MSSMYSNSENMSMTLIQPETIELDETQRANKNIFFSFECAETQRAKREKKISEFFFVFYLKFKMVMESKGLGINRHLRP